MKKLALLSALVMAGTAVASVSGHRWHNAVPYGMIYSPDSDLCHDGAETKEGSSLHISCGPEDKTVRFIR